MIIELTVSFFLAVLVSGVAATLWVLYMIKLVTNEEELAERVRAERRRREEIRRQQADRQNRRKASAPPEGPSSVAEALETLGAKPPGMQAADEDEAEASPPEE